MHRPHFDAAWSRFSEVNVSVMAVGRKLGGKVAQNIASGIFQNACPIRMSYVLNYSALPSTRIPRSGYAVVSGADGFWYMFRVGEMMSFLERLFGQADKVASSPSPQDFFGMRGIVVVKGQVGVTLEGT